jgi:glycosyltransferase involved in cell wall biosynthesis
VGGVKTAPSRRKLHIAVVTETYPPEVNGVARTIGVMVAALRDRGHRIQLVRPRQAGEDGAPAPEPGLETVLHAGFPLPRYRELRMGLPAKRALAQAWRARRPDVVQVVTEGPLGNSAVTAARTLGIPVVSEFHTNFHDYSRHYGLGLLSELVARYLRRLHNRADLTLVPTAETQSQLAATGYKRLAVVGRGIDLELFDPRRRSAALRGSWGAGDRDIVALSVGRLAPEKNLRLFTESCRAMQAVVLRLKVVVVGDGPDGAPLRAANRDFVFAGMRTGAALAEHYASADVFVFPSLTETFGNVTTEAMASRLAIVAFDYAAARQHLRHRASALLAPFGAGARFVEAAQELAADPRLRGELRDSAAGAARGLTWARVVDDLEAILVELVTRSRAARVAGTAGAAGAPRIAERDHAPL